jgi:hypothetical protein
VTPSCQPVSVTCAQLILLMPQDKEPKKAQLYMHKENNLYYDRGK